MSEFFFVIKSLVLAVLVIMLLQIKVGTFTLEERSLAWIQRSAVVDGLRGVAEGAVKAGGTAIDWVKEKAGYKIPFTDSSVSEGTDSGEKRYSWKIRRSAAYYKRQEAEQSQVSEGPTGDEID